MRRTAPCQKRNYDKIYDTSTTLQETQDKKQLQENVTLQTRTELKVTQDKKQPPENVRCDKLPVFFKDLMNNIPDIICTVNKLKERMMKIETLIHNVGLLLNGKMENSIVFQETGDKTITEVLKDNVEDVKKLVKQKSDDDAIAKQTLERDAKKHGKQEGDSKKQAKEESDDGTKQVKQESDISKKLPDDDTKSLVVKNEDSVLWDFNQDDFQKLFVITHYALIL